jgi:phage gpG-like protein
MAKQNKFNFKGIEKKARTTLENAMVEIGNTAKVFFVENFRKQGFDDKTVEKWEKRKKTERKGRGSKKSAAELGTVRSVKAGRAILVKTGDLRRSIIRNPANRAALSIKIHTDLPYAKIHNDGGTINREGFKGLMYYREVATNLATRKTQKRFARTTGIKSKRATHAMEINVGAYTIDIDQRQFMGDSYNLNEQVKKVIVKRLDKIFK